MHEAYERYYRLGHYDERYPRPNRSTLARIREAAPRGATLLDIGSGNGRYAIPLARLGYQVVAVERSDTAREQLAAAVRASGLVSSVSCYKDLAEVDDEVVGSCRLTLLLFGVLGHMRFEERRTTLLRLRRDLPPGAQVLGSVPNRFRRFKREQLCARIEDQGAAPRFTYSRRFGGSECIFEYTAFSPSELNHELVTHGWTCVQMWAESLLGESIVTRHRLIGLADGVVSHVLPPPLGYDIIFEARPGPVALGPDDCSRQDGAMGTNVTDYLKTHDIDFTVKRHQNPALTCETAALERGVRVSQIVKCMVGETDQEALVVMLLPGDRTLKSSKARKWLKAATLQLVPPERLEEDHGLTVGAISPIDFIGKATILMDPSVLDEAVVDISSGDPLAGVELSSEDLRKTLGATLVDIISTNSTKEGFTTS